MIVLNLFIGVIMNGMAEMQAEYDLAQLDWKRREDTLTFADEIHLLLNDMNTVKDQLALLQRKARITARVEAKQSSRKKRKKRKKLPAEQPEPQHEPEGESS